MMMFVMGEEVGEGLPMARRVGWCDAGRGVPSQSVYSKSDMSVHVNCTVCASRRESWKARVVSQEFLPLRVSGS
jgi:hypothetical protein